MEEKVNKYAEIIGVTMCHEAYELDVRLRIPYTNCDFELCNIIPSNNEKYDLDLQMYLKNNKIELQKRLL